MTTDDIDEFVRGYMRSAKSNAKPYTPPQPIMVRSDVVTTVAKAPSAPPDTVHVLRNPNSNAVPIL